LRKVFERCREFGISSNPKTSVFGAMEGKLLAVTKNGVKIDLARIEAIHRVPLPWCNKSIQSFFSEINFLQWFVLNLVGITKPISKMLRKRHECK
jgi:hypothetical protein